MYKHHDFLAVAAHSSVTSRRGGPLVSKAVDWERCAAERLGGGLLHLRLIPSFSAPTRVNVTGSSPGFYQFVAVLTSASHDNGRCELLASRRDEA